MPHQRDLKCFVDADAQREFNASFAEHIAELRKDATERVLGRKGTQRFSHGGGWAAPPTSPSLPPTMRQVSAQMETKFEDLLNNDLSILRRAFEHLAKVMHEQFMRMLYATVSDACEKTGNTVDAKQEGSLANAFLAMLERVEFAADPTGKVSMPEIHVGPEAFEKFQKMEAESSPEFAARVEQVKARKIKDALAREAERKARFVRYGG